MSKLQKIKFVGVSLSTRPDAVIVDHPQGVGVVQPDGSTRFVVNKSVNGNLSFNLKYRATDDRKLLPQAIVKTRRVWADENGNFDTSASDYQDMVSDDVLSFMGTMQTATVQDGLKPFDVDGVTWDHAYLIVPEGRTVTDSVNEFNDNNARITARTTITKQDELVKLKADYAAATSPVVKTKIEANIKALETEINGNGSPSVTDTPETLAKRVELATLQASLDKAKDADKAGIVAKIEALELELA